MKKLVIALMALSMIGALTGCTDTETSDSETVEETTSAVSQTTEESTAETEVSSENVSVSESDVESNLNSESEESDIATSETNEDSTQSEDGIYNGTGYIIAVDADKWTDISEYSSAISDAADSLDMGVEVSSEDIANLNDGMFMYTEDTTANFNVVVNNLGAGYGDDTDMSLFSDIMQTQYDAMNGCEYLGGEVTQINGYNCFKAEVTLSSEVYGSDMKMAQYMFLHDGCQYVITYSAKINSYDVAFADFEDVLNSFTYAD